MSQPQQHQQGPPYPSKSAGIGGLPTNTVDTPICAVLLLFYIGFAVTNNIRFNKNRRRDLKFLPTIVMFGFCMARIVTLIMRIVWANYPRNVRIAIAANVFLNAGILILYVINLIFAHRILKAEHPKFGWSPIIKYVLFAFYAGIGISLAMVILSAVWGAYTLSPSILSACRDIQLAATTYLFVFVLIPIVLLALSQFLPKDPEAEEFGEGSLRSKKLVVLIVGLLLILLSGFKTGTTWETPRPMNNPAWYQSKYCLYFFNFFIELVVLTIFTIATRPDKMFHVPNGSKQAGDYTRLLHSSQGSDSGIKVEEKV